MARTFNADEQTRELLEAQITIGGQEFHPARLTPDVRRDQMKIATTGAKLARQAGLADGAVDLTEDQLDQRAEAVESVDQGIYRQLCVLLRDEQEDAPAVDFLTENIDNRVASRLLNWLLEDLEGEEETAPTPVATGS